MSSTLCGSPKWVTASSGAVTVWSTMVSADLRAGTARVNGIPVLDFRGRNSPLYITETERGRAHLNASLALPNPLHRGLFGSHRDSASRAVRRLDGSPVSAEEMHARGWHLYLDRIPNLRQGLVRERRHEAVRPGVKVDVTGAAKPFHQ